MIGLRIFHCHADVAELADAKVSEACDGDIVEVQVLSSAPFLKKSEASPLKTGLASFLSHLILEPPPPSGVFKTYQTGLGWCLPRKNPTMRRKEGTTWAPN